MVDVCRFEKEFYYDRPYSQVVPIEIQNKNMFFLLFLGLAETRVT